MKTVYVVYKKHQSDNFNYYYTITVITIIYYKAP